MVLGGEHTMEKKDINIEIGRRIKIARETAGLTQDRFAELIVIWDQKIYLLLNEVKLAFRLQHFSVSAMFFQFHLIKFCLSRKPIIIPQNLPRDDQDLRHNSIR